MKFVAWSLSNTWLTCEKFHEKNLAGGRCSGVSARVECFLILVCFWAIRTPPHWGGISL